MRLFLPLCFACAGPRGDGDDSNTRTDSPDTPGDDSGGESGETSESGESGDSALDSETGPVPIDADGDGYTDAVDCDDSDPAVHPGAEDPCDAFDQDCDGLTWSTASCGEDIDLSGAPLVAYEDDPFLFSDLTGDGVADLIVASDPYVGFEDPAGTMRYGWALYPGGAVPEPLDAPVGAAQVWFMGQDTFYSSLAGDLAPLDAGDVDGDGTHDLLMIDHGYYYGIYVHLGPFPLDGGVRWMNEDADALWDGNVLADYCWMMAYGSGADLDGDGRTDFVGSSSGGCGLYDTGDAFNVFLGGTWGDPVAWIHTEGTSGVKRMEQLEDLDGDGIGDVHVHVDATHSLLSGADLPSADGAYVEDLAFAAIDADAGAAGSLHSYNWWSAGDWTGDGLADLLVPAHESATLGYRHGEVFVVAGGMSGELSLDDAAGSWVGNMVGGTAAISATPDADGDGGKELVYWDGSAHYLVRHELPALRTPVSGLTFPADVADIYALSSGDLNADGYDDFSFARFPTGDAAERTGHVWFGFDIPWNDAAAWLE